MEQVSVLPAADEAVRCADFTRRLRVDPGGTAIRADVLVAAETPLPWPKPAFDHPLLAPVPAAVAAAPVPVRVLAAVPSSADALKVVSYRRCPTGVERAEWRTDQEGLTATVTAIVGGEEPAYAEPVAGGMSAEVWICTQGSHDMCCGADGTRLAQEVTDRWVDVTVRRVSHTGGHRFAPTGVTLPDGRMWGYLDLAALEAILTRTGDPAALADRCRGWWGAAVGPAQVAERALLTVDGWAWESAPRTVEVLGEADGVTTVRISAGEGPARSWLAEVRARREVPTISCRAPGGLPAKPGIEYELVRLRPES